MRSPDEDARAIQDAARQFPAEFQLRALPGDTCAICASASYVNDAGQVMLYVFVKRHGAWMAYAKGTIDELRKAVG